MSVWLREASGTEGFPRRRCPLQTAVQLDAPELFPVLGSQWGGWGGVRWRGNTLSPPRRGARSTSSEESSRRPGQGERDMAEEGFPRKETFKPKAEGVLGRGQRGQGVLGGQGRTDKAGTPRS